MKILGVVTARAGSVRLPGKNLAMLGNKPLIAWSIEVGLKTCNKVVTTTDGDEIARQASFYGSDVVQRPPELATGAPWMHMASVLHAHDNARGGPYDAILLLQPTSPFRTVEDVQAAKSVMERTGAESVISVIRFPVEDTLFKMGWQGRLRPAANDQDWIFTPNGAIFLAKTDTLREPAPRGGWYGPYSYAYEMPRERSVDIDTRADFEAAAAALAAGEPAEEVTRKKTASFPV